MIIEIFKFYMRIYSFACSGCSLIIIVESSSLSCLARGLYFCLYPLAVLIFYRYHSGRQMASLSFRFIHIGIDSEVTFFSNLEIGYRNVDAVFNNTTALSLNQIFVNNRLCNTISQRHFDSNLLDKSPRTELVSKESTIGIETTRRVYKSIA